MIITREQGGPLTALLPSSPPAHPEAIFDQTLADLSAHPLFGMAPFHPVAEVSEVQAEPAEPEPLPEPQDEPDEQADDPALDQAAVLEPAEAPGEPDDDPDRGQEQRARDMLGRWTLGKPVLGEGDTEPGDAIGAPAPIESDPALAADEADDAPDAAAREGDTAVLGLTEGEEGA